VDERRDPEKATRAAAKDLLDLYKQFGSWYLAAASYNCGEGRVQRELNQSNHKNFWELSANMCLPTETKNYVPQMIAATIIAKNPEKFGLRTSPTAAGQI
jgi:membrane-bound lytic murein transglycosylase D